MISKLNLTAMAVVAGLGAVAMADGALARQAGQFGAGPMMMLDFATVDADGDGKITQDEVNAYRQGETAAMDADGDGLISEAELADHVAERMQAMAKRIASARITAQDADGDGKLSAAEMQMSPMAARIFERFDSDSDGALSEAEIDAGREKMVSRGDRDHRQKGKSMWFGWGGEGEAGN